MTITNAPFGDSFRLGSDPSHPGLFRAEHVTSWLYTLTRKINTARASNWKLTPSVAACRAGGDVPLAYRKDVGWQNAVGRIAGWMFHTTGRLTSGMVINAIMKDIHTLVSRSGFTARCKGAQENAT